jgi:putative transposase
MKIPLLMVAVQSLNLLAFAWFNREACIRILALRQQLNIYKRKSKKPVLRNRDRLFWSVLSKLWGDWMSELILVKPETVIRWRKRKFREFWRRKSQGKPGRPAIPQKHIEFIRRISSDHPEYGEDRIALELEVKFGIHHACSTIRRYMVKRGPEPTDSQAWRSFLKNQAKAIWSCDFFVQPTIGFRILYIFVLMELASRKVIHFNVTDHPTLEWTKQQIRNACFEEQPKFLLHDNDGKFGQFGRPIRLESGGKRVSCRSAYDEWLWAERDIRGIAIPYGAPNAAAHIERLIGTLRRECLDRMLIWNERHLRCVQAEFIRWYDHGRVHQGLNGIPDPDPALTGAKLLVILHGSSFGRCRRTSWDFCFLRLLQQLLGIRLGYEALRNQ